MAKKINIIPEEGVPGLKAFLDSAETPIPIEDMSLEDIEDVITSVWFDRVDRTKPPSGDNDYIKIYDGWSTNDEEDPERYWMFSAQFPINGYLVTGLGGFLKFWNRYTPVMYNGVMLPVAGYNEFIAYCKSDDSGEEE